MSKKRLYRREDNGKIVKVGFVESLAQDAAGYITLPDGVRAHRCVQMELDRDGGFSRPEKRADFATQPIISDALGFIDEQLPDFERDRVAHGFSGVEFVRDPTEPRFMQVKCGSRAEWERYVKHRGLHDMNRTSGAALSPGMLERAEEMARRGLDRGEEE